MYVHDPVVFTVQFKYMYCYITAVLDWMDIVKFTENAKAIGTVLVRPVFSLFKKI